ncbi:unnamed protein product [Rotaria sordida]|uniref:alanine--glyoxylate transaminase n=1 Tax=Rotaria sordida TaxID=392033 RepID=A0A813T7K3_9BILA|nr:unnamed protein product [Rotaria sordida]
MTFHQAEHPLLVIPGSIEVSDDVLLANASPSQSHMSKSFVQTFGETIKMFRQVLVTERGQPFIVAGSGTLGWDMVASNLTEPGDEALVLHSGYFGQSFADCLETYGAKVTQLKAPVGQCPSREELVQALKAKKYKIVTITHVDTSTGVLSNPQMISEVVHEISPDTLIVLDGVCSVGSEVIRMDEWSLDVVMCASQKGLGVPPGLSLVCASERAIRIVETRKTKINSYFASWLNWLPVMRGYEQGKPVYFATPPIQIICALHTSLKEITSRPIEERWARHKQASIDFKQFVTDELGLKQVPSDPSIAANGMTAIYFPDGLSASDIIPRLLERGIVVAGGLHKEIKDKYFRIGHMGITVMDTKTRNDLEKVKDALRNVFKEAGYVLFTNLEYFVKSISSKHMENENNTSASELSLPPLDEANRRKLHAFYSSMALPDSSPDDGLQSIDSDNVNCDVR